MLTHITVNRSYFDLMAFVWLGRIQGIYKSKQVVKRLKNLTNG